MVGTEVDLPRGEVVDVGEDGLVGETSLVGVVGIGVGGLTTGFASEELVVGNGAG